MGAFSKITWCLSFLGTCLLAGCGGAGDGACSSRPNSCETLQAERCSPEGTSIQSCLSNVDGCKLWVGIEDCPGASRCADDGLGSARCVCADACPALGQTGCEGDLIITCQADVGGCLAYVQTGECITPEYCDDSSGAAVCETTCPHDCTEGEQRCHEETVQECQLGQEGCRAWITIQACQAQEACQVVDFQPQCVVICDDACPEEGSARCELERVEACTADADGCLDWVVTEDCTEPGLECVEVGATASCEPICQDECFVEGFSRCDGNIIDVCAADGEGCLHWVEVQDCYYSPAPYCIELLGRAKCSVSADCQILGSPTGQVASGSNEGLSDDFDPSCGSANSGADICYLWIPETDGGFQFDTFESTYDTVLQIMDGEQVLECNDDSGSLQSMVQLQLTMGDWVMIIVDAYNDAAQGWFLLNVNPSGDCPPNDPADRAEADDANNSAVHWLGILTVAGPGTPEATGLTLEPGTPFTITGTGADNGEVAMDNPYMDVDSFQFNSGTASDVLVLLDVAGTDADLDVLITDGALNQIALGMVTANGSADALDGNWEEIVFSSADQLWQPGQDYVVSVGVYQDSAGLPVQWQLTFCAH